jgi:DnaJ-class molecular chaperone
MSIGRSFIKGPRFAFKPSQTMMACEACAWGTGAHTCEDRCSTCEGTGYATGVTLEGTRCVVCGGAGRLMPTAAAPRPSDALGTRDGV